MAKHSEEELWSEYLPEGSCFRETADVVLAVEGRRLIAHKACLALHSEVFRDLFNDMISSEPLVLQECFSHSKLTDMMLFLKYIYYPAQSLFTKKLSPEEAIVLAKAADQFNVPHLLEECNHLLDVKVEKENLLVPDTSEHGVLKWALLADIHNIHGLLSRCERMIVQCFPLLKDDPRMGKLSVGCWQRIACGLGYSLMNMYSRLGLFCNMHGCHGCKHSQCLVQQFTSYVMTDFPSAEMMLKWQDHADPSKFMFH